MDGRGFAEMVDAAMKVAVACAVALTLAVIAGVAAVVCLGVWMFNHVSIH